jgi:FkbM family methyltransferase
MLSGQRGEARERAKLALRRALMRADLEIGRTPYARQVARTMEARGMRALLDVGANVGQYAALVRAAGFDGQVISLEPLPDAYARLERRMGDDPHWHGLRLAAGAAPGRATIHVSANSYSSSLLRLTPVQLAADPRARVVREVEVDVTTVADVSTTQHVDPARTLLKVDTQGFESEVLDGAGALLDRFAGVQLELSYVEMYAGQVLAPALVERLAGHGLEPWTWSPGVSGPDGRLLQADVLFVRA